MKHTQPLLAGLLMLASAFPALATSQVATGCEAKRQDIEHQRDRARLNNNTHREAGLEKALAELNAHCTDDGLRAEREADIRKKELKTQERRQELNQARSEERTDKINKKQKKLDEAEAELAEAKSMLNK